MGLLLIPEDLQGGRKHERKKDQEDNGQSSDDDSHHQAIKKICTLFNHSNSRKVLNFNAVKYQRNNNQKEKAT